MFRPLSAILLGAALSSAATIITVSDPAPNSYIALGSSFARAAAASWTQSTAFTGVTVSAHVMTTDTGSAHQGTAWLTNSIGPGTTNANVVATGTFLFSVVPTPGTLAPFTTLFTGLTLGPGTYYLILLGDSPNVNARGWQSDAAPNVSVGSGVTSLPDVVVDNTGNGIPNYAFLPDSTFVPIQGIVRMLYSVTGTDAGRTDVPEPITFSTIGAALLAGALWRRKS